MIKRFINEEKRIVLKASLLKRGKKGGDGNDKQRKKKNCNAKGRYEKENSNRTNTVFEKFSFKS